MLGITRYILRQLFVGMIFVSAGLACILWLTQSLRFIELIISRGTSVLAFVYLTLMLLPSFLIIVLPISLFAVVLFAYNKLTTDRELIVLRAAGMGPWQLSRAALLLALATTALGYALTLHFSPVSVQSFRELQWEIRNDASTLLLQEGVFNEIAPNMTIYVRSRSPDGELTGILVHDRRDEHKTVTMMAERGALVHSDEGPRVLLVNGNRQEVRTGEDRLAILYFDSYTLEFGTASGSEGPRFRDARERSLEELLNATEEDGLLPVDIRRFQVEAHNRFAAPLYALTYAALALACLLTGGFNRRGQTGRVVVAIGAMIAVQAASLGATNLATGNLALIPLLYLVPVVPAAAACFLLIKDGWRRPRPAYPRLTQGVS